MDTDYRDPGLFAGRRSISAQPSQAVSNVSGRILLALGLGSAVVLLAVLLLREPVKRAARGKGTETPPVDPARASDGQTQGGFNLATMWPHLPQSDRAFLSTITASQIWDIRALQQMNPDTASVKTARSIANTAEQFVRLVQEPATRSARKNGYPDPKRYVAQAALESGWGKKAIGGTNLFGHAATPDWSQTGKYSLEKTHEYKGGVKVQTFRPFRVYNTLEQAFDNHFKVLDRFPGAKKAISARAFAESLVVTDKNGKVTRYATDPAYPKLIDSIYGTISRLWL